MKPLQNGNLMYCKVADLIIEVPEVGDLFPRCREYLCNGNEGADIIIRTDLFRPELWTQFTTERYIYFEAGNHFSYNLLKFGGIVLHASAIVYNEKAYLFSAPSGTGKSTHTRLWQQIFGEKAEIINDDKPALRCIDGIWYAYGTPWCGKDGINSNKKAPLAGICFLKQAEANRIRRLSNAEAVQKIIWQTMHGFKREESLDRMLASVDSLVRKIPVFELENRPEVEAAMLSYETMRRASEEAGL